MAEKNDSCGTYLMSSFNRMLIKNAILIKETLRNELEARGMKEMTSVLESALENLRKENITLQERYLTSKNIPHSDNEGRGKGSAPDDVDYFKSEDKTVAELCAALEKDKHEISDDIKTLQSQCRELNQTVQLKKTIEQTEQLEKDVSKLRMQRDILRGRCRDLKSKQTEGVFKKHNDELKALEAELKEENKNIRLEISEINLKIAKESTWKTKCKVTEISKSALKNENKQLKKHLRKITEDYEEGIVRASKYKQKVQMNEDLTAEKEKVQQEIKTIQIELANHKVLKEVYQQTNKEEDRVKALNKKLEKNKLALQEKLLKLKKPEREILNATLNFNNLTDESRDLFKEIQELNQEIENKNLLKAHLQTLKDEIKSVMKINGDLKQEVVRLTRLKKRQKHLLLDCRHMENLMKLMERNNQEVQEKLEKLFVETEDRELLRISNDTMSTVWQRTESLMNLRQKVDSRY